MRISDWSSAVCSSDLIRAQLRPHEEVVGHVGNDARPGYLRLVPRVAQRRFVIPVLGETAAKAGAEADGLARGFGEAVLHATQLLGREPAAPPLELARSEEHTSELQSLMRTSNAVFCVKKKNNTP